MEIKYIKVKNLISEAALLEQLAEEASELAKAALKKARILRGENPTPVTEVQAELDVIEEFTDVVHVSRELGICIDEDQVIYKNKRWINRIKESKGDK